MCPSRGLGLLYHSPPPQILSLFHSESGIRVIIKCKQNCDMIDNHIEDPEEGNVKFSSELDMIFNESDQEL